MNQDSENADAVSEEGEHEAERSWSDLLIGHLPLEAETAMFILVNVLDFLMTYLLLSTGKFRESNPIAEFFLHRWGPVQGMLYFKLSLVVVVCVIAQIIALKKPATARWLLNFGTVIVVGVVVYSLTIFLRAGT
ncbi:hypothetical protein KOR42_18320 [Thalassoglobus neptunius]|uniref:DUF5658 domain-containing protein n=1 Tax=Thalassoglobus neptunius TaxID=1938619 RepID=A0A5C5X5S1_9PLAN|nr:DUF5658 family protein [Thalassoglobus neptunius]TWT58457.1 hypothetical protein KOR42_18320 [Thalassoglobus neptunius]